MFNLNPSSDPTNLENAIDELITVMRQTDENTDEYGKLADRLVKLHKLKMDESPKKLSADTVATVLGNLAVVLVIVSHERAHVLGTRAGQFLMKLR